MRGENILEVFLKWLGGGEEVALLSEGMLICILQEIMGIWNNAQPWDQGCNFVHTSENLC